MGNELSRGSFDVPDTVEAHQLTTERDSEEQPARKTSSDMSAEMDNTHSDEESASQIVPQQEVSNSFSLPAEETGAEELQENSQEGGHPLSLSQSASLDKAQPICELATANPPVEHSSEKGESTTPQIPPEAAGEPDAETGEILLTTEDQSLDAQLQKAAEDLHCLAESALQEIPSEISTCSPKEKEEDSEMQNTIQSKCDHGSFEVISEINPEMVASGTAEGQSSMASAIVTQPLEAQKSTAAELRRAEMALLPTGDVQVGQREGCSEVDAQTTEGVEDKAASGIPKEADSESTRPQQVLVAPKKPLASSAVEHANTEISDAIGGYLTTEAMNLVEEHSTTATVQDPEAEPLLDHLAESSSTALQEPDEAKEPSLRKELVEASSDPGAIEMTEPPATMPDECPQPGHASCPDVKLTPVAQETEPVVTADVEAQGSPGAQQDSTMGLEHAQKQEAKFPKTFYCCCSPCNAGEGEGEGNAEQ